MDFEAPPAPDSAAEYLPDKADSFGEGLLRVGAAAVGVLSPALSLAARCCLRVFGALVLVGLARQLSPGLSTACGSCGRMPLYIVFVGCCGHKSRKHTKKC